MANGIQPQATKREKAIATARVLSAAPRNSICRVANTSRGGASSGSECVGIIAASERSAIVAASTITGRQIRSRRNSAFRPGMLTAHSKGVRTTRPRASAMAHSSQLARGATWLTRPSQ